MLFAKIQSHYITAWRRIFFETSCFSEETFDPNGRELVSCSAQELFLEMYNNVDPRMFGSHDGAGVEDSFIMRSTSLVLQSS